MSSNLGLPLLWFIAIVAMIPLALWLLKRSPMGAAMGAGANAPAKVVASLPLGPNQRVLTLEVGQGDERRWLLVGVTPQSINALHTLTPPPAAPAADSAAQPTPFAALMSKFAPPKKD
ncbi:FliO/MopB family protein [Caldimonas sp. KR1-144]|uniref:FliO/MopB family protein n=1 Tax=Caldimonas sp. KR1-144 TaxID=3400911 RepID=UPI003C0653BE